MGSGLPVEHPKYKPYVVDTSKALDNFGDVNFLEHGGKLLLPGVGEGDAPYLEVIDEPCDDEAQDGDWLPSAKWVIFRMEPEQLKTVEVNRTVYLVSGNHQDDWPHPASAYDTWFHKDLEDIAGSIGMPMQDLRDMFCSDNVTERCEAYIAVASHHGWINFDQYPLTLSQHEAHSRYGALDDCQCEDCMKERN
jgi:hypothetical protein